MALYLALSQAGLHPTTEEVSNVLDHFEGRQGALQQAVQQLYPQVILEKVGISEALLENDPYRNSKTIRTKIKASINHMDLEVLSRKQMLLSAQLKDFEASSCVPNYLAAEGLTQLKVTRIYMFDEM